MQVTSGANSIATQLGLAKGTANSRQELDQDAIKEFLAKHSEEDLKALYQQCDSDSQNALKKLLIELGYANLAAVLETLAVNPNEAVVETSNSNLNIPLGGLGVGASPEELDQAPAVADGPTNPARIKNLSIILDRVISHLMQQSQLMAESQSNIRKIMAIFAEFLARYSVNAKFQTARLTVEQAASAADEQYNAEMTEVENHKLAAIKNFVEAGVSVAGFAAGFIRTKADNNQINEKKAGLTTAQENLKTAEGKVDQKLMADAEDNVKFEQELKERIGTLNKEKDDLTAQEKFLKDKKPLTDEDANKLTEIKDRLKEVNNELKTCKTYQQNLEKYKKDLATGEHTEMRPSKEDRLEVMEKNRENTLKNAQETQKYLDKQLAQFDKDHPRPLTEALQSIRDTWEERSASNQATIEKCNSELTGYPDGINPDPKNPLGLRGFVAAKDGVRSQEASVAETIRGIRHHRVNQAQMGTQFFTGVASGIIETQTTENSTVASDKRKQAELDKAYGNFLNSTGEASAAVIFDLLQEIKDTLRAEKDELFQALAAVANALSDLLRAQQAANSM